MRPVLLLLFALFLFPASAFSQNAQGKADRDYLALVEKAQSMPTDFDFGRLRSLYTQTSFYSPFGEAGYKQDLLNAFTAIDKGDLSKIPVVTKTGREHFGHYKSHTYLGSFALRHPEAGMDRDLHGWALRGLAKAILNGKTGRSIEDAIKVIDVSEEYFVIRQFYRGSFKGQKLINRNGVPYDVTRVSGPDGKEFEAFFDISIPFAGYDTALRDRKIPEAVQEDTPKGKR
jgi:hypothetical protein